MSGGACQTGASMALQLQRLYLGTYGNGMTAIGGDGEIGGHVDSIGSGTLPKTEHVQNDRRTETKRSTYSSLSTFGRRKL